MRKRLASVVVPVVVALAFVAPSAKAAPSVPTKVQASKSPVCVTKVMGMGFCVPWTL